MKNKKVLFNFSILVFILSVFAGCSASKNNFNEKKDEALIKVNESSHEVKKGYENTKHTVKKSYLEVSDSLDDLTSGFYENNFVQFFVSDKTILENRKNLVVWQKGSWENPYKIIRNHLRKKKIKVDPKGLELSAKIKILNNYYYKKEQNKFKKAFSKKHARPKFDEFKSDRENIEEINKYKFQLIQAKNQWEIDEKKTQKKVAAKTLAVLYGKPKVKKVSYDANKGNIYLQITSSKDKFLQNIFFEIDKNIAKKMKSYKYKLKPIFYFTISNNTLNLIGASVIYKDKNYLANFSDDLYKRQSDIKFTANGLDLSSIDLDYKIVSKNVNPPKWFYNLPNNGRIIGYGMGDSEQEAKNAALKEIAQQMGVRISSQIKTSKKSDGNNFSSRTSQNISVKTKNIKLKGTKTIKSQKKNRIWFIAIKK